MEVGRNTPEVEMVWIGYTDGSCYGERGSARRGRCVDGCVPKRRKKGGEEGGPVRGRGMGVESRLDARKKGKCIVHKDGECGTMPRPRENGELKGPTQMASVGHATQ